MINQNDEFIVTSSKYRTQEKNHKDCYSKLSDFVKMASEEPKEWVESDFSEKEEVKTYRVDMKRKRSEVKKSRGKQPLEF